MKCTLEFISRDLYKKINGKEFQTELIKKYGDHTLIPEGGFSIKGVNGAKLICNYFNQKNYIMFAVRQAPPQLLPDLYTPAIMKQKLLALVF